VVFAAVFELESWKTGERLVSNYARTLRRPSLPRRFLIYHFTKPTLGVQMETLERSAWERFTTSPPFLFIAAIATIYGTVEPIRAALESKNYGVVLFYVVVIGVAFCVAAVLAKRSRARVTSLYRNIFRPFEILDRTTAWPRRNDETRLVDTLKRSDDKPIILVGESGSGKTVLVESQIIPIFKNDNWLCFYLSNYSNFRTQVTNQVRSLSDKYSIDKQGAIVGLEPDSTPTLVVFDQFEQFLSSYSDTSATSTESRNWFKALIDSLVRCAPVRVLIVVRKEWYYDLRFLAAFVPPPMESVHLTGMRVDDAEGSVPTLKFNLARATKNELTPDVILQSLLRADEISPIEAQIVGCMLENKERVLGPITPEIYSIQLGGKDSLIQEYFETILSSSPNRDVALQILFALSIETRYRSSLTLPQIVSMTHQNKDDVRSYVHFLEEQRLIIEGEAGHYQLSHDYLAERFHDISGTELDPKQRDNILFFGDELRRSVPASIASINVRAPLMHVVSDWFMGALFLLLIARVMAPAYGARWQWFNPLASFQSSYFGVDTAYLPVFVSHTAWSYYVTIFYRRIFSRLKEGVVGSALSVFTLIACFASVALATFLPHYWMFSIGFGGFWIGVKLLQLSVIPHLSTVSRQDFRVAGRETIFNVSFVVVLGALFGRYIDRARPSLDLFRTYQLVSIPAFVLLTYTMYLVFRLHVSRKAASIWLGMFDRRPSRTNLALGGQARPGK
jgi:hypothetical protein